MLHSISKFFIVTFYIPDFKRFAENMGFFDAVVEINVEMISDARYGPTEIIPPLPRSEKM